MSNSKTDIRHACTCKLQTSVTAYFLLACRHIKHAHSTPEI